MIKVLVEMKNDIVVLFSKYYTVDEAKELHRQLGNFLASHEAAQQSVQRIGGMSIADEVVCQMAENLIKFVDGDPANR